VTEAELAERIAVLDLLNVEIKDRMNHQAESVARVETKAAIIIGFAITAVQLFIPAMDHPLWALPAIVGYALAVGFGIAALVVRQHRDPPDPAFLWAELGHASRRRILGSLIKTRAVAHQKNARDHRTRVIYWWISLSSLIGAVVASATALLSERIN
jgi:hypothetical protein